MIASAAPHRILEPAPPIPDREAPTWERRPGPVFGLRPASLERVSPQLTAQLNWQQEQIKRGFRSR